MKRFFAMRKGKRVKMQSRLSWRLLSLFLLIFVSSAISLIAQETRFKTWNTENGLPQNSVNSIAQTRDGYIWLATFDGLARFDGVRFKVFRKQDTPELPTNRLRATFVDNEGRLLDLDRGREHGCVLLQWPVHIFHEGQRFRSG